MPEVPVIAGRHYLRPISRVPDIRRFTDIGLENFFGEDYNSHVAPARAIFGLFPRPGSIDLVRLCLRERRWLCAAEFEEEQQQQQRHRYRGHLLSLLLNIRGTCLCLFDLIATLKLILEVKVICIGQWVAAAPKNQAAQVLVPLHKQAPTCLHLLPRSTMTLMR